MPEADEDYRRMPSDIHGKKTTSVIPFTFNNATIRTITQNGEPWFVLADVCRVLEIVNVGGAVARLDDDEKSYIRNADATSSGGNPNLTIVNESGLYSLILTSRKPEAKAFKKWITSEVIPSIRKTGGYSVDPMRVLNDPAAMPKGLVELSQAAQTGSLVSTHAIPAYLASGERS